jgi:REP element-mobilizing transposase RayT
MPRSFTCLHYHLIFSTKHREASITNDIQPRLFEYLGGILRNQDSMLVAAGGVAVHFHLVVSVCKKLAI